MSVTMSQGWCALQSDTRYGGSHGYGHRKKIAEHKPALSRKDKQANREAVKQLAAVHMEAAIKELSRIISDKNTPASARVAASTRLLDRVAGRPVKEHSEANPEREFDRMSEAQLLLMICSSIAGLSQEARSTIAEALLAAGRHCSRLRQDFDPDFSESEALRAEAEAEQPQGLPPREPQRPKKSTLS